jgi:Flp pilus assembly protein TadG
MIRKQSAGQRARWFWRGRDGATVVEFALVAPPLALVIFGLIEFGMFAWRRHSLEFATEETARVVMTKTAISSEQVAADLKSRVAGIKASALTTSVTEDTVGTARFVTLSVSYTYSFEIVGSLVGIEPVVLISKTRVPLRASD